MHIYVNIYVFLYVTYKSISVLYGLDELAVASETRNEINIAANAGARRAANLTEGLSWGEVIGGVGSKAPIYPPGIGI